MENEIVRCKDCVYWQDRQIKLEDGTYRDYTEDDDLYVTLEVGINVSSYCALYNKYHQNMIPQFMGANDFCSKGYRRT